MGASLCIAVHDDVLLWLAGFQRKATRDSLGAASLEELQPFPGELFLYRQRLPGHGAAGMGKAGDNSGADRIGHDENHRDRKRSPLGGKGCRDSPRNDDFDL